MAGTQNTTPTAGSTTTGTTPTATPTQASAFEKFVNTELPKRISTDIPGSGNLPPGKVLRTTGIGLGVEAIDADDAGSGITEHSLVVNATDKVIPKGTPLAAAAALNSFDLTTGKLHVRPTTIADKACVGIANNDIGASDLTANIFAEGQALLRGIIVLDYKPDALDTMLPDLAAGKTITIYANADKMSCDTSLGIPVGQIIRFVDSSATPAPTTGTGTTGTGTGTTPAAPTTPTIETYVFVTLQGVEYAGSVGGVSTEQGTVVIDAILGTSKVAGDHGPEDKVSYQIVDQTVGIDANLGQPQLLAASLIEQANPVYLAIQTAMTLESGSKLKVINKADNTAIAIKTPVITLQNGLKNMVIEFEDPTAVYSLAAAAGTDGLYLQVIHPAGGKSDPIVIKTKSLPAFGTVQFTLPAGQTSVKSGDNLKVKVTAPANYQIATLEVSGEILYDKTNNGKEQSVAIFNSTKDPSKFADSVEVAFNVTTKELSLDAGADLTVTLTDGTILYASTKELGNTQNYNWVQVDNVYPTLSILSVAYPAGQTALKGSEKATLSYKAENIEKIVFTTPDDQVSTDKLEMTFASPDNQTFTKDVTRIGGEYNITTKNFVAKAMKVSNGSFVTVGQIVNIADKAAQLVLTVMKQAEDGSWAATKENKFQSSPAAEAEQVFFRFDLDSDQQLTDAPTIALNGPGIVKGVGVGSLNNTHIEYQVRAEDSEARGAGDVDLTKSANLAGVPCVFKVDDTTKLTLDKYSLAGFVKRKLKVAAWPNRHVEIGVEVVDPTNLQCSNLSKGASGSLNFSYQLNTKNMENGFTLVDSADVFNPAGGYWYNCDQSNALSNTSGEMLIELEEAV